MQITLVRHGEPDHNGARWCTPREMKTWIEGYNQADIIEKPLPAALQQLADEAGAVVSSSLSRCQQSTHHLVGEPQCVNDRLFAEAHLPYPDLDFPRLPVRVWRTLFRGAWFLGFSRHTESIGQSSERARQAAERLIALAQEHGSVLLMGHGIMNILIARHLRAQGWKGPQLLFLRDYWHPSTYRKPGD
ncbi:fructose-2,6-bisphosphatase [Stutzerimonas nosocomialis]|uniref:histidine phosphatase family protein n=1 Tax=Stutzerimonas nosocomialis TaxID=1056496 RepID=UPI00110961BD|nr:histidine phosphatase family protein [Stutzerimonas nosocomialis]TLX56645.1 fructose-2,6-bisphosphatase [Stutzerimonas nosocomialis]